jgi:hypothetical protein
MFKHNEQIVIYNHHNHLYLWSLNLNLRNIKINFVPQNTTHFDYKVSSSNVFTRINNVNGENLTKYAKTSVDNIHIS